MVLWLFSELGLGWSFGVFLGVFLGGVRILVGWCFLGVGFGVGNLLRL